MNRRSFWQTLVAAVAALFLPSPWPSKSPRPRAGSVGAMSKVHIGPRRTIQFPPAERLVDGQREPLTWEFHGTGHDGRPRTQVLVDRTGLGVAIPVGFASIDRTILRTPPESVAGDLVVRFSDLGDE